MLRHTTLAFIGSGMMAEAMIKGMLNQKLIEPEHIIASGPRPERAQELRGRYGIRATTDNCAAARASQIVVLSVKPQTLPKVLPEIRGAMAEDDLVISIVAGATILARRPGGAKDRPGDAQHAGPGGKGYDRLDGDRCHR